MRQMPAAGGLPTDGQPRQVYIHPVNEALGAIMDIDKRVGQSLADKSAVGAINRPLQYCQMILLMNIIGPLRRRLSLELLRHTRRRVARSQPIEFPADRNKPDQEENTVDCVAGT